MFNRVKYFIAAFAVVFCFAFLLARCSVKSKPVSNPTVPLLPTETERLIVAPHQLVSVTPTGTTTQYVPPNGNITVSVDKTGKVTTHVQTTGFVFKPGFGVGYADKLRLSLDFQLGYMGRFGGHVGIGVRDAPIVLPFLAASYRLDQVKLPNTSLMVGKTLGNAAWWFGLRTEF